MSRLRFSDIGGMAEVDEQRVCIKFCVRLGGTGSEILKCCNRLLVIRAWAVAELFEWFGRFKNGRTSTANDDQSGRPSTATTP